MQQRKKEFSQLYANLGVHFGEYTKEESDPAILAGLRACRDANFLGEDDINQMRYDYLMMLNKPKVAEGIFRANTILYPNSPNVFDSYGEALLVNGDDKASLKNYEKAVEIATKNESESLELYRQNLEKVKQELQKR